MIRWVVLSIAVATACASQTGSSGTSSTPWKCVYPDALAEHEICHCFDGDVRCTTACPSDLSAPCTPDTACGDLSGGSNYGQDCECTCDSTGAWGCVGPSGACTPMP